MNFTKREDECSVFTVSTQVKKKKKSNCTQNYISYIKSSSSHRFQKAK